jgi:hypothetical protein
MQTISREIRGIPYFLIIEYLQEMGGKLVDEAFVEGPSWTVRLSRIDPFRLGSLVIGQTRLDINIEDDLLDDFLERLNKKTLRAGA